MLAFLDSIALQVRDLSASRRFYEALGFETDSRRSGAGRVVLKTEDGAEFALVLANGDVADDETVRQGIDVTLIVKDAARLFEKVRARTDAKIIRPLTRTPHLRTFEFIDANGHALCVRSEHHI